MRHAVVTRTTPLLRHCTSSATLRSDLDLAELCKDQSNLPEIQQFAWKIANEDNAMFVSS